MTKKTLSWIALALGIAVLLAGLYLQGQKGKQQGTETDHGKQAGSKKAGEMISSGYVYWDQREQELKYRPCGERKPEYRVRAQGLKNRQWSALVEDLKNMPGMPRFVTLAAEKGEAKREKDAPVLLITRVLRIDARGNCKEDRIVVTSPLPGEKIESPLSIQGRAKGSWYFEGDFPVLLTDWDGLIIAQGIATAQGEWMTQELVPFTCRLTFETPSYGQRGTLILRKDNPSDKPALDDALEIPVRFE